ncbi:unnamed protein product, partial [marine sediment metagenome]
IDYDNTTSPPGFHDIQSQLPTQYVSPLSIPTGQILAASPSRHAQS